jgi:hypothetical protein
MVTQERTANKISPIWIHRAGVALLWFGVLTWVPFILMRASGVYPSIFWFLPFHLTGVIGGSRLRVLARKKMGQDAPKRNPLRTIGHILVFLAISVWGIYFYLKLIVGQSVDVNDFLPYHLIGIFSGIGFLGTGYLLTKRKS